MKLNVTKLMGTAQEVIDDLDRRIAQVSEIMAQRDPLANARKLNEQLAEALDADDLKEVVKVGRALSDLSKRDYTLERRLSSLKNYRANVRNTLAGLKLTSDDEVNYSPNSRGVSSESHSYGEIVRYRLGIQEAPVPNDESEYDD